MIFEKLCALIAEQFGVEESELELTTSFEDDLHADSLDLVELVLAIEEEFSISQIDEGVESIKTIGDAVNVIKDAIGE